MKTNLYKFFDRFGIAVFLFLFLNSLYYIKIGEASWDVYVRLIIGAGGFLVDGYLVFFHKDNK
ncbi:MAG: hypothetical protein AAB858_00785 [Patescibacteria group bacterium]